MFENGFVFFARSIVFKNIMASFGKNAALRRRGRRGDTLSTSSWLHEGGGRQAWETRAKGEKTSRIRLEKKREPE
jgi:hypothetical protein